jgi:hypothetical protein
VEAAETQSELITMIFLLDRVVQFPEELVRVHHLGSGLSPFDARHLGS